MAKLKRTWLCPFGITKMFTFLLLLVCHAAMAQTDVVEFDFTSKSAWTAGNGNTYTNAAGYTITLKSSTGYFSSYDGAYYLMLKGKDATLTFPTFTFGVEKIEVVGNDGASTSVKQNIFVGSKAVSTEATGAADSNSKAKTNVFVIQESYRKAGTKYVFKNINDKNSQITYIRIYPVGSSSSDKTSTTTTFGSDVNGKTFVVPEGETFQGHAATVSPAEAEGTLAYASDNTAVATVAQDGAVTLVGAGTATITATFTPTDAARYASSSAYYTIIYNATVATTLSFAKTTDTAYLNLDYTLPALTLTADGKELAGAAYTYASSDASVATVDADGTVTLLSKGITTITAHYDDASGKYQSAEATLTLTVAEATSFEVAFDASKDKSATETLEKDGVSLTVQANKGNFNLMANDYSVYGSGTLTVATTRGNLVKVVLNKSTSTDGSVDFSAEGYKVNSKKTVGTWTGKAPSVTLTNKSSNRAMLSSVEVTVSLVDDITLADDASNDALLGQYLNRVVDAKVGRTLEVGKGWYTLCLPFAVEADSMATVMRGASVMEYEKTEGYVMRFGAASSIVAGRAYLVKPKVTLSQPVFHGVTIAAQTPESQTMDYSFAGTFSPKELLLDGTNLFLGMNNLLYKPKSGENTINSLRGYFVVPSNTDASKLSIAVDDEQLSIDALRLDGAHRGKVYSLQGQLLGTSVEQLPSGIYIVDGQKVVVK